MEPITVTIANGKKLSHGGVFYSQHGHEPVRRYYCQVITQSGGTFIVSGERAFRPEECYATEEEALQGVLKALDQDIDYYSGLVTGLKARRTVVAGEADTPAVTG
jgi:hypothetical protein